MCIAILNEKGILTKEILSNSWENNDQGAGLLYNHNGKLITFKTYNKKEFIKTYFKVRSNIKTKIVLHFRIATSGFEQFTNLHPFLVNDNLGFVHNGVISGLGNNKHSDTYQFNEMLKKLKPDFLTCQTTVKLIQSFIGSSKLIFLNKDDSHHIINENLGQWIEGNWYSNDSHKKVEYFSYFGNSKIWKNKQDNFYAPFKYSKKQKNEQEETLMEYLSYYTNVTELNIREIEESININRYDPMFIDYIEETSFFISSTNLNHILDQLVLEQTGYKYNNLD
jgi:predicted glutamine amidotransferase